jgi:hypothetical protein
VKNFHFFTFPRELGEVSRSMLCKGFKVVPAQLHDTKGRGFESLLKKKWSVDAELFLGGNEAMRSIGLKFHFAMDRLIKRGHSSDEECLG